jgi:hypothetical protein
MGEVCGNAAEINGTLFQRVARTFASASRFLQDPASRR